MCLAVGGGYAVDSHRLAAEAQIAVRWDGARWSAIKVPMRHVVLFSVACASTNDCTVIGAHTGRHLRLRQPISIRWHDGRWSSLAFTVPRGVTQIEPSSISCPAPGSCVAVGSARRPRLVAGKHKEGYLHSLVLHERGDRWSVRLLPDLHTEASATASRQQQLNAVSCPPRQLHGCVAVGSFSGAASVVASGGFSATIGTSSVRQQLLTFDPRPSAISCPTVQLCLVAGNESIERFDRGFSGNFFGG
jgi:hypothetical protein